MAKLAPETEVTGLLELFQEAQLPDEYLQIARQLLNQDDFGAADIDEVIGPDAEDGTLARFEDAFDFRQSELKRFRQAVQDWNARNAQDAGPGRGASRPHLAPAADRHLAAVAGASETSGLVVRNTFFNVEKAPSPTNIRRTQTLPPSSTNVSCAATPLEHQESIPGVPSHTPLERLQTADPLEHQESIPGVPSHMPLERLQTADPLEHQEQIPGIPNHTPLERLETADPLERHGLALERLRTNDPFEDHCETDVSRQPEEQINWQQNLRQTPWGTIMPNGWMLAHNGTLVAPGGMMPGGMMPPFVPNWDGMMPLAMPGGMMPDGMMPENGEVDQNDEEPIQVQEAVEAQLKYEQTAPRALKTMLEKSRSDSGNLRFFWTIDSKRLDSSDTHPFLSPVFELHCGSKHENVVFKMMIRPKFTNDQSKGAASFKKVKGNGCIELMCTETLPEDVDDVTFQFALVSPEGKEPRFRGPVRHNFGEKAVGVLPKEQANWDLRKGKNKETGTFIVCLEILPNKDAVEK